MTLRSLRTPVWFAALALALAAWCTAPAAAAVSQKQAERKAIAALGLGKGKGPVVLFRERGLVPRGTAITQAGPRAAARASRAAVTRDRALKDAGVTITAAPVVLRTGSDAAWFFYEDQAPYQAYEHPGRVVLVARTSGRVTVSRKLGWPPLIAGRLPRALADYAAYRSPRYRAFARSWVLDAAATKARVGRAAAPKSDAAAPSLPSTLADTPAAKDALRRAARLLAAEKSCAIRISDTLGDFYDAGPVDTTRAAFGRLLRELSDLDAGFFTDRYTYRQGTTGPGRSPQEFVAAAIEARGCKDVLIYIAGGGTTARGGPAVNIGTKTRAGGRLETQTLSAATLRTLITSTPGVTFKVEVDAPRSGAFVDALGTAPNLIFSASSSTGTQGSFTALEDVVDQSGAPAANTYNASGLLEFTNRQLQGLGCFLSSPEEVAAGARAKERGRTSSFLAWMLARSLQICGNGYLPQAIENASVPQVETTFPAPTDSDLNQAPIAAGGGLATSEDTALPLTLTGADPDGDALTFTVVLQPQHGTIGGGDGPARTYTPAADFAGEDRFAFTVSDGRLTSAPVTVSIAVRPVNDRPVLTLGNGSTTFSEAGPAVAVDPGLTLADVDDARLSGASARIAAGAGAGDTLDLPAQAGISASFSAGTGVLTLTGEASVAAYEAALRAVTFRNPSTNLSGATRQIVFTASDAADAGTSPARPVAVAVVNDAPTLVGGGTTAAFTEDDATGVLVAPAVEVADVDSPQLASATLRITGGLVPGEDELVLEPQSGIVAAYAAATGTLTLTGAASPAEYQAALRSVRYRNLDAGDPTVPDRTVTIRMSDGSAPSAPVTTTVTVARVNDAPTLVAGVGAGSYTEGDPAVAVAPALTAADADDVTLVGATASIVSDFAPAQDLLAAPATASIATSYDAATGVLTLTGSASVAEYQAALRSVTYRNTSEAPAGSSRSIAFAASDAAAMSLPVSSDVTVEAVNDAPVLGGGTGSAAYVEDDTAGVAVHPTLTVGDVDSDTLAGATVALTTNRVAGQDELVVDPQNGITGAWNAASGVLTLTGSASLADYRTALRSVRYRNLDLADPSTLPRTAELRVSDGAGTDALSDVVTSTISVTAVNDAPSVSTSGENPTFTEGGAPVVVDPGLGVADVDDANLSWARVTITSGHDAADDVLALPAAPGLTATFAAATGTLTITGSATKAAYRAALRSVTYENTDADAPSTVQRTLRFVVSDGHAVADTSTPALATVQVAAVNDAPVLAGGSNTVTFTEDDATGVIVNGGITVADVDGPNLTGATIQITANRDAAEDELLFVAQNGITGSFDAATGLLTLSGTASVSSYQAALRSIRYRNTDTASPTTAQRVITFAVTDGAATSNASNSVVTNVTVTPSNDAPVLTAGSSPPATFTEGASDVTVDPGVAVADVDSANLTGATVGITQGLDPTEDRLVFTDTATISGTFNAATGVLALSGTATVAEYQAALRSIAYSNVDGNDPSGLTRTITFLVSDGALVSNTATRTVGVQPVEDAPVLTASAGTAGFTEGGGPVAIDGAIGLVDVDTTTFTGATAQITGAYAAGQDTLGFLNTATITGSWNAATGTLTLTGSDSPAAYQAALRAITFENGADAPSVAQRTITFSITDAGPLTATATRGVTVTPTNDAPVVTAGGGSPTYVEGAGAVIVDPGVGVVDPDGDQLVSATVAIGSGFSAAQDRLVYSTTNGIGGSYDVPTGILTLSGTASAADYRAALRAVGYQNLSSSPSTAPRVIGFRVSDGSLTSSSATTSVQIQSNNTAPVLGGGGNTLAYTEDDLASIVNGAITATDPDDTELDGATVQITANGAAEDELTFSTLGPISGSWNAATRTLTLTGSDTVANYQAALRTIRYVNTNGAQPSGAPRTVRFTVTDGEATSDAVATTVTIAQNPDAPVLTAGTGNTKTFTEGGSPAVVDDAIVATDVDSTNLTAATASITSGFSAAQGDTLAFTPVGGITGAYDSASGVLTLSGSSSAANYQAALRSVVFSNTSNAPTSPRTVSFTATGGPTSAAVSHQVLVQGVNSAPTLSGGGSLGYTEDDAATAISPTLALSDLDSTNITGATVAITTNLAASQDVLSFINTANITGSFNSGTGTLTLSGSDTVAAYQAALRAVRYANTSQSPSTAARTVTYTATDDGTPGLTGQATATIGVTSVNDAPSVTGEVDTAVGNTRLAYGTNVPAGRAGSTRLSGNVLANDTDVDSPGPLTVDVATSNPSTAQGGSVAWNADGTFSYDPPAGYTGTDTLTYRVSDGATPVAGTTSGTVTVVVSSRVWYVDNSVADGGDGRSTRPFDTLAEADAAADAPNDRIYVHEGSAATTKLGGGVTLLAGQQLIGEAKDLVVGSELLLDSQPADRPSIAGSVQLDDGNVVQGLDIQSQAANAPAIAGGAGDVSGTLDDLRLTPAAAGGGVELLNTSGTWTVSNTTVSALGAGASGVRLVSAGSVTFVNTGTVSVAAGLASDAIVISATEVAGTIDAVTATNAASGVQVFRNTGALILSGLNLVTSGPGLVLDSSNGISTTAGTITAGGTAVDINRDSGGAVTSPPAIALGTVSSTGGSVGLRVSGTSSGGLSATGGSLTGHSTAAVGITGGNGTVVYGGTIGNGPGRSVEIAGRTGGSVTLSGAIADTADAGGGVVVTGGSAGTVTLSGGSKVLSTGSSAGILYSGSGTDALDVTGGGLAITTTSGAGVQGTAGGTLTVQGSGNTVSSTTGAAIDVNGPDIGAAGATFESVSSNGAASGIVLADTGSTGGLRVTGTGGAASGGTIENSTGAGILLTNTSDVRLASVRVRNGADDGIRANGVNGLALTAASQVTGNGNAVTERGLDLTEQSGAVTLTGLTATGNAEDNVAIVNDSASISNLSVDGGTYGSNSATIGNDGILLQNNGSGSLTGTIQNATFSFNRGDHIQLNTDNSNSTTQNLTIQSNAFRGTGNQPGNTSVGGGISLGAGGDATQTVVVDDNDIERPYGSAIALNLAGLANTADGRYTVTNNTVGTVGEPLSGAFGNVGVYGNFDGNGTVRTRIDGNDFRNTAFTPIDLISGNGDVVSNHTIRNNVIAEPRVPTADPATQTYTHAIRVVIGGASTDNGGGCLDIGSATPALANQFAGTGQDGFQDLRVRNNGGSTVVNLAGYGGTALDNAAVNAYLVGRNSKGGTPTVSATRFDNTLTWGQVASCPLP